MGIAGSSDLASIRRGEDVYLKKAIALIEK
jgi:hypothetical protein